MSYTDREKAELKERIVAARGYWHPFHEGLLAHSPSYLEAYLDYQDAPARAGNVTPRMIEFIYIAADASVTHLYATGLARHIGRAIELGATRAEIIEVIQLTMTTSHFSHEIGIAALAEELALRNQSGGARAPEAVVGEIRDDFVRATGKWPETAELLLDVAPHLVRPFLAYAAIPWKEGPLPPREKALILLAVCVSPTTRHLPGVREHIRTALDHGATPAEIADVIHLASAISIHTCTAAIPLVCAADLPESG